MKHTPGPWTVGPNVNEPGQEPAHDIYAPDPSPHAEEGEQMIVADYLTEANAQLIALAPEMAECLREIVQDWQDLGTGDADTISKIQGLLARLEAKEEPTT